MIGLYIFAGIIIFFIILMQVSTSVRVSYDSANTESLRVYAKIGFYKLEIIPLKPKKLKEPKERKKRKKRKKTKKEAKKNAEDEHQAEKKDKKDKKDTHKYTVREIIEISKDLSLILFKKLRKYLKIRIYKINIKAGAKDAYKTAMLYANINRAAYYLYEILRNNFNLKVGNINISSDFLSEKIDFDIDIKVSIKIGGSLNMLIAMAVSFVKFWAKNKKNKKSEKNNNKNDMIIKKERVEVNGRQ